MERFVLLALVLTPLLLSTTSKYLLIDVDEKVDSGSYHPLEPHDNPGRSNNLEYNNFNIQHNRLHARGKNQKIQKVNLKREFMQ